MKIPFLKSKKKEPSAAPGAKAVSAVPGGPPAGGQAGPAPRQAAPIRAEKQRTLQGKKAAKALQKGMVSVVDLIAPSAVEVDFNHLKINAKYHRTLFVAGYPRYVSANWLYPLISFDHSLFVSMFVCPQEAKIILEDLKRKIAEMEATIQGQVKGGKVVDPSVQVALDDALVLQAQLAKGAERFFQFGLYITIPADSIEELNQLSKQVESALGSLMIISKHATLQMEEGLKTCLPYGKDFLSIQRNMDTTSLATTFPFSTASLTANEGILYGINEHDGSLVIFDRFSLENANAVVFGKSGGGKSLIGNTIVLIKEANGGVKLKKIGDLVENIIGQREAWKIDEEIEGVINPGIEVFTFNKNLKGEWAKVTVAARKKISKRSHLYRITTKSGREVTVTPDHCTVVLRKGKVRAIRSQDIKVGEAIPLPRFLPEPSHPPNKIIVNQFLSSWPKKLSSEILLDDYFLNLLGLLTSEGCIRRERIDICNQDHKVQEIARDAFEHLGLNPRQINDPRFSSPIGIRVFSADFFRFLLAIGATGKAGEKRIPPLLYSLSNKQVAAYLRAYFEGDGCVEEHKVTCSSKSKYLISDICYLLYRFGIIARLHKKFKRATNTQHKGSYYWELAVSGQDNLQRFAQNISFLTKEKQQKLNSLLGKQETTNVDTIPSLEPVFRQIYRKLYTGTAVKAPTNLSPLKRGVFSPSPAQLKKIISLIEERIKELKSLRGNASFLRNLPNLEAIVCQGKKNRQLNRRLWTELGQTWRIMKNRQFQPLTTTVLRAQKTITGETVALPEIKHIIYETFQRLGEPVKYFDSSLQTALTDRPNGDLSYQKVIKAASFLQKKHRSLQQTVSHLGNKLSQLKILADSDLFWDPIVKIEKIKNKDPYVYDLTVDNEVFLAGFGGMFVHNSFLVKLETLRSLMFGAEVFIIDPEGEYETLTEALGGEFVEFSFSSPIKINPFDLSGVRTEGENELGLKILSLHSLMKVVMGELSSSEEATLDRALVQTYRQKGITPDPETQTLEPPLMEDLYKVLVGMEEAEARGLAERLEKFIKGSLAGIFNQKSNLDIKNPFTVFCIKDLEAELRPIAMFIILDYIWTKMKREKKKRLLIVDEAWYLMKHPDSANFLYGIAKRARKYYLGLTTITQDVEDFLESEHGKPIITNSSIQILLKQSPAAIDKVAEIFYLSSGEKHFLLSCEVGEGLFFAGPSHVALRVVASADEYELITTKPEETFARKKPKTPAEARGKRETERLATRPEAKPAPVAETAEKSPPPAPKKPENPLQKPSERPSSSFSVPGN